MRHLQNEPVWLAQVLRGERVFWRTFVAAAVGLAALTVWLLN